MLASGNLDGLLRRRFPGAISILILKPAEDQPLPAPRAGDTSGRLFYAARQAACGGPGCERRGRIARLESIAGF
jgi:hypothetical protein